MTCAVCASTLLISSCGNDAPQPHTFAMGEKISLGKLVYTAYETQWLTQLGEGVGARVPQNRFFVVRISAGNSGAADLMLPALTLQDDSGNTFSELTNGEGVPQWLGVVRQVKPAEAAQGNIVFDAPPRHYKLRVTDEDEQKIAYIDIPFTLESEAPVTPIPGSAKKQ